MSQKCYFFQVKNQKATIDISDLSNTDYVTLSCSCSGITNERATVATIKGWTSSSPHPITAYVYSVINAYYSSGSLVIEGKSDNGYMSEVSVVINS